MSTKGGGVMLARLYAEEASGKGVNQHLVTQQDADRPIGKKAIAETNAGAA